MKNKSLATAGAYLLVICLLLITHYHTIRRSAHDAAVVPPREVLQWTEQNSRIPLVGCWNFFVEDGGALAFAVSSFEQGDEAAKDD